MHLAQPCRERGCIIPCQRPEHSRGCEDRAQGASKIGEEEDDEETGGSGAGGRALKVDGRDGEHIAFGVCHDGFKVGDAVEDGNEEAEASDKANDVLG